MTTKERFGDIELRDYLRMVSPKRPWRRSRALLTAAACVAAFAAGRFGPWSGKGSEHLTLQEALAILDDKAAADWGRELASAAILRHGYRGAEALQQLAKSDEQAGTDAAMALGWLAVEASKRFLEVANDPRRPRDLESHLKLLRKTVQ